MRGSCLHRPSVQALDSLDDRRSPFLPGHSHVPYPFTRQHWARILKLPPPARGSFNATPRLVTPRHIMSNHVTSRQPKILKKCRACHNTIHSPSKRLHACSLLVKTGEPLLIPIPSPVLYLSRQENTSSNQFHPGISHSRTLRLLFIDDDLYIRHIPPKTSPL